MNLDKPEHQVSHCQLSKARQCESLSSRHINDARGERCDSEILDVNDMLVMDHHCLCHTLLLVSHDYTLLGMHITNSTSQDKIGNSNLCSSGFQQTVDYRSNFSYIFGEPVSPPEHLPCHFVLIKKHSNLREIYSQNDTQTLL